MIDFLNLKIGAKARLAILRKSAKGWPDARYAGFNIVQFGAISQGFNDKTPVWCSFEASNFRWENYVNNDCSETVTGVVGLLNHGRFIAGYENSDSGERVYFGNVFNSYVSATIFADAVAEQAAESMYIESEKYNARDALKNDVEDRIERLVECIALRNNKCYPNIREEAVALIGEIQLIRNFLKTYFGEV
jgi:hypothetical protein